MVEKRKGLRSPLDWEVRWTEKSKDWKVHWAEKSERFKEKTFIQAIEHQNVNKMHQRKFSQEVVVFFPNRTTVTSTITHIVSKWPCHLGNILTHSVHGFCWTCFSEAAVEIWQPRLQLLTHAHSQKLTVTWLATAKSSNKKKLLNKRCKAFQSL